MPARRPAPARSAKTVTLLVTLARSSPLVWRRLRVPVDLTLLELHRALQLAMGWEESHLFELRLGEHSFTGPIDDSGRPTREMSLPFESVLPAPRGVAFRYLYDFGDGWEHFVGLEEHGIGDGTPVCLDGARACPPEDCGGIEGYHTLVEAVGGKGRTARHRQLREWVPQGWDPSLFDLRRINAALKRLR